VISHRVARLLTKNAGIQLQPTTARAEVFGEAGSSVDFAGKMAVRISFIGGHGSFTVQVMDNMAMDCIVGDDVISKAELVLDYKRRVVSNMEFKQRMLTRGEVILMMTQTKDLDDIAGPPGPSA
jgi:hypothetical protein